MNRLNRSLDNLLTTIEGLQRERDHLAAALNHIIRGVMHLEKCDVLNSPLELMSHIEEYLSAWIVLTNVSGPPIAVPWEEIKAMEAAGTLWDWINDNWYENTQAIAIPGEDD